MNTERTQIEINKEAEALLNEIAGKALVIKEGEKITVFWSVFSGAESSGDYGSYESIFYSLFLTSAGLIEQKSTNEYISESDGVPYSEDNREYPVKPSPLLAQHYNLSEDDIDNLEQLLHQLQSRL